MKIKVLLKGYLVKYFKGEKEKIIEINEDVTIRNALELIGIDPDGKNYGFVAVNGMKIGIDHPLKEGDELKIYPRMSGG